MEGLRVSKLKEGQQWGKNTSAKDKVERGRRPPFIEAPESNCYVLSPCTSGTIAQGSGTTAREVEHGERSETECVAEPYERHYHWSQRYYHWPHRYCRLGHRYYRLWRYAVLPLRPSGTTAGAILMPLPRKQVYSKENQNCQNFCK